MKFQKFLKKIIDFVGATIGLIIFSPLFLTISILIKSDSKGPVFFRQERIGRNGKIFTILKFRSMVEGAEKIAPGLAVSKNDPRITRVGKFLRRWTLDELPQFINVLRGEMSLVGPRPLPRSYFERFDNFSKERLLIKPGIVSLVDIRGREMLPWEERFKLDVWYVKHWSLWLDLKILFLIPFIVFLRGGVYGKGGVNKPLSKWK